MFKYDIMNVIFVSSRVRGRQEHQVHRAGDTVNITVPNGLVLRLLPEGAILQIQNGPVPYTRPDSAWPLSRPNSGRSPRPTFRKNSGRDRPISPFTDWSSIGKFLSDLIWRRRKLLQLMILIIIVTMCLLNPVMSLAPQGLNPEGPEKKNLGLDTDNSEEGPGAPNIFTDSVRGKGRGRGIPVQ